MKTNFNEKLFEKQIDVKASNLVTGGIMQTDCSTTVVQYSQNGTDTRATKYSDDGSVIQITMTHCSN